MTLGTGRDALKIVCLTEDSPGLRYTVNRLHARFGVDLVIFESSKQRLFRRDLKRFGLAETLYRTWLVARRLLGLGRDGRAIEAVLGSARLPLDPGIPVLRCRDVNAPEVRAALAELRPDVLVCQGTTLVRAETLAGIDCALNIHAGLSPYYRGSRCTEWALAVGDVANVGVTVHRLTAEIDGGGILGQARVAVEPGDDVARINTRIVAAGTDILIEAIERLAGGAKLVFRPQPAEAGLHLRRRQWSRFLDRHLRNLLSRGELERMIRNPSAAPLPLIAPWPPATAEAPLPGLDRSSEKETTTEPGEEVASCRLLGRI